VAGTRAHADRGKAARPRSARPGPDLPAEWQRFADLTRLRDQDSLLKFLAGILGAPLDFSLFATDPDGRVLLWSEGSVRTYGYPATDVIGRMALPDLSTPPGEDHSWRDTLNEALKQGHWNGTQTRIRQDGAPFTARVLVNPVRGRGGGLMGFLVASRDISGEAQQTARLQAEVFRLRAFLDRSPVPLLTIDLRGVIEYANQAMAALMGHTSGQLIGTRLDECFAEPDRQRVQDLMSLVLREGQVTGYQLSTGPGHAAAVSCGAQVVPDQDRKPHGMVVSLLDTAERRRLERDLADSERFSDGLAGAADGLVTIDHSGVITDVSDPACELYRLAREELVGSTFCEPFTDTRQARHLVEQTFATGRLRDFVLSLTVGDGSTRQISFNTWVPGDGRMVAVARDITAQVTRQEIADRERSYTRGLIEASADGLAAIDVQGRVSDVNARMCALLRTGRDELIGREFTHLFTDPGLATELVNQALLSRETGNYQLQLAGSTDTTVSVNASAFTAESGEVAGVFASARDISEQARLQQKISSEQAYNRALIESSAEAFFAISPGGIITDVNALASTLTGRSRKHLIGRPFSELFGDPESARRQVTQAFRQGRVSDYELALATGEPLRIVSFSAGVFRDPADQPQGLLAAVRDVSAQKAAENHLREQQLYARSLFEANMDALLTTDASGRITDTNKRSEELAGRQRDALIGCQLSELVTEPERAGDLVSQVLRDGHLSDAEITVLRPNGGTTVVSCSASTFTDSDGKLQGLVASARDITGRKKLEEEQDHMLDQARKLDQAKTDFVSRVSHELRSPLTGVLGYTELLRVGRPGPLTSEQQRVVGIIERNGKRLLAQIEDLLLLSRLEVGKLRMTLEPVDLAALIRGIHESYLPAIQAGNVECRLDLDPGITLDADAAQLERLMANLVSNAVKFTPAGGHIGITARRDADTVVIQVHDDGIGIPPGEQDRLFSRFFRSSLSSARETRGTGLGLFIVKQVAEGHGGSVTAESAPGAGSTFTVRIPAHRQPEPGQPEQGVAA
jgi:PAS domain S-box-containing protein